MSEKIKSAAVRRSARRGALLYIALVVVLGGLATGLFYQTKRLRMELQLAEVRVGRLEQLLQKTLQRPSIAAPTGTAPTVTAETIESGEAIEHREKIRSAVSVATSPRPSASTEHISSAVSRTDSLTPVDTPLDRTKEHAQLARWRVAAIARFLPLSDDQRRQLHELFSAERGDATVESILGAENYRYLRERQKEAFKRAEAEEQERELYFLSRRLGLDVAQEAALGRVLEDVEAEVSESLRSRQQSLGPHPSPTRRMELLIETNQLRATLMEQRLRSILNETQLRSYLEYQATAPSQDMEIWHSESER